jgi:putative transposase
MPRNPRNWTPGTTYHITARGNRKEDIFLQPVDRQKYLFYLQDTQSNYPFTLHAYCLMSNHLHLLVETSQIPIHQIFRILHTRYAIYFNRKYDLVGHLFQGRYGASKIDTSAYFISASRYIHRNPLEANLTSTPENYPWSSYASYVTSQPNPYISKARTLAYFPTPSERYYREYVEKQECEKDDYKDISNAFQNVIK